MNYLIIGLRLFLGVFLLANGLNFWLSILPITPPDSEAAVKLMDALVFSGLFGLVKYVEVISGVLLIINLFVPFALMLMLPLSVVIFWVDVVLIGSVETWIFALLLVVPQFILMLAYIKYYIHIFAVKARHGCLNVEEAKNYINGG